MKLSNIGRILLALVASASLGLGMTACGGGTIGYMWVLGTQYNQISAYKIDDYTGNLTQSPNSPFTSGGVNPASIVVKTGGRFVYVVNEGVPATVSPTTGLPVTSVGGSISEFSVGSDGILVYQQSYFSQGTTPLWATLDSTGNYLYVLDKFSAAYCAPVSGSTCTTGTGARIPADLNGDVTAFSVDGNTGRLTLVTNVQSATGTGQTQLTYFEVGVSPKMVKIASGCLYALSSTSLYPLSINGSNGQLTTTSTGIIPITIPSATAALPNPVTPNLSSINTGGTYVYLTDTANNTIYAETASATACALSTVSPGVVVNLPLTSNPINTVTSNNGKFLYVINQSSTSNPNTPTNSSISAFTIDSNGALAPLADSSNPYSIGSGPVCVVQDPTSQYLYTSNNTDSTVTGKVINQNTGVLSTLPRGSSFPATGKPSCLAVSGNI